MQHQAHVQEVTRRLLAFQPPWKIKAELMPAWGFSVSFMDQLLREANELIVESVGDWDLEFKKHVQRGHALIERALEKGDLKTATTMFAALSRLGLEKTSVDVTSGGQPLISFGYAIETAANAATNLPESPKTIEIEAVSVETSGPGWSEAPEKAPKSRKKKKE